MPLPLLPGPSTAEPLHMSLKGLRDRPRPLVGDRLLDRCPNELVRPRGTDDCCELLSPPNPRTDELVEGAGVEATRDSGCPVEGEGDPGLMVEIDKPLDLPGGGPSRREEVGIEGSEGSLEREDELSG